MNKIKIKKKNSAGKKDKDLQSTLKKKKKNALPGRAGTMIDSAKA
jgi:hypothetical protein